MSTLAPITNTVIGLPPQQVWNGGSGVQPFMFNNSETVTLYIGPKRDVLTQNVNSCIPVPPLGGQAWPDQEWWAFVPSPNTAQLLIIPGALAWSPSPVQTAIAVSLAGIPLIPNDEPLVNDTALSVPVGTTNLFPDGAIEGTSYEFSIDVLTNGATTTCPFGKLSFIWKNAVGGTTLAVQQWIIPYTDTSPANANSIIVGRGPTNAGVLNVRLNNFDTQAVTVDFCLYSSARVITRHDARSVIYFVTDNIVYDPEGVTLGGYSTAFSEPAANILAAAPSLICNGAGGNAARVSGIYAGQAQLNVEVQMAAGGNASLCEVSLFAIDPDLTSALTPLTEIYSSPMGTANVTFATLNAIQLTFPRTPIVAFFINNDPTHSATFHYSIVSQEFAS